MWVLYSFYNHGGWLCTLVGVKPSAVVGLEVRPVRTNLEAGAVGNCVTLGFIGVNVLLESKNRGYLYPCCAMLAATDMSS